MQSVNNKENIILDVELEHRFAESSDAALKAALIEAANTGAVVLALEAVDVEAHRVTFIGTLPDLALTAESGATTGRWQIKSLHTTWGAVLAPSGNIGFLLLAQPVLCRSYETDDPTLRRVAVSLPRAFATVAPVTLGPICCVLCRRPIPTDRLKAIPGKKVCLTCQQQKEEAVYASR